MTVPDLHELCGWPLIKSVSALGCWRILVAAFCRSYRDSSGDSHHFFLSVGSGVFSASSEADDSDHLHGRSFNRGHHLRWSVRQVKLASRKASG